MKDLLLSIELVPKTAFFKNLRSILTKAQWDIIRHSVYSRAWGVCEVCNKSPEKFLDAHEVWHYDDVTQIQKLTGLVALCEPCHQVKHFGFATIQGKAKEAFNHFKLINNLTKSNAEKHIQHAFEIWAKRSSKNWTLDISYLKEYGIKL